MIQINFHNTRLPTKQPEYDPEQHHYETVEEAIRDGLRHDIVSEDTGNQQINLIQVIAD